MKKAEGLKVSAIIPTYNYAKYVLEAVESVLRQTYGDIEVIVVDDGSTDGTEDLLKPYTETKQIKYIFQKNSGNASARNTGILAASGDLIAFLDSDDIWLEEKVEIQVSFLLENLKIDAVFCNEFKFKDGEEPIKTDLKIEEYEDFFEKFLLTCYTTPSSLMVRKKAIEKSGLFNTKMVYCEDWDFLIRLAKSANFGYIPDYLLLKRDHKASMSGKYLSRAFNYKELYYNTAGLLDKRQLAFFKKNISKKFWKASKRAVSKGRMEEALKLYSLTIKLSPLYLLKLPSFLKYYRSTDRVKDKELGLC